MHPRVSLSAISTFEWSLERDLAFYEQAGITNVGVSVTKLERAGWDAGLRRVADAGLRVTNLIGLGPFRLDAAADWPEQRERLDRVLAAADALDAECVVFTTGPAGQLTWEDAADALEEAITPTLDKARPLGVPFALEHTNSLRIDVGFVHTLADVIDLADRLSTGVCMEVNSCWAERGLEYTIARGVHALRLVQVSDFAVGTLSTPNRLVPGDGDIPLERIVGQALAAGYAGCFDLELIGPRIEEEGYASAAVRSVGRLAAMLDAVGGADGREDGTIAS